jgi:hypothetical protein
MRMRMCCLAALTLALAACSRAEAEKPPVGAEAEKPTVEIESGNPPFPVKAGSASVEVEMRNVNLHVTPQITLHVKHLRGRFIAAGKDSAPYLDDKNSYSVAVETGEVAVDLASLNALMARTMGGGHSNVKDLRVSIDEEGRLRQKGKIDKAIDIPFNVKSTVSVTPDGRIRVHSESVKGFGVPIKPVMKLLSLEMDDLLKVDAGRGVTVAGNDLLLDVAKLLPSPGMRGRLTAVRIEGIALVQTFGSGAPRPLSPKAIAKNYIYWRGGQLAFGKLLMTETDLELVDMDPGDPFDFSVDRWNEQLVAGYSKSTPRRGLKSHMPDYNDLARTRTAPTRER